MTSDEIIAKAHRLVAETAAKIGSGTWAYNPAVHPDELTWAVNVLDAYNLDDIDVSDFDDA